MADALPTALYDSAQMRALDDRLIAVQSAGPSLMEKAARAAWRALQQHWSKQPLTVLAGSGNNAGDAYELAALAQQAGWSVHLYWLSDPEALSGDAARAWQKAQAAAVPMAAWHTGQLLAGIVVDGLLGTGLRGAVRAPYAQLIEQINASDLPVLALDIPSGLCASTGQVCGVAVKASLTVTFIGLKLGLFTGAGPDQVGRLQLADLQADPELLADHPYAALRLTESVVPRLPARPRVCHKGRFGHVLVIGGDQGMAGAALLAAKMALRGGAGLVSVATRIEHGAALLAHQPELMVQGVASASSLSRLLDKADVLVLGPGLGVQAWGRSLYSAALASAKPMLLDADALNLLAQTPQTLAQGCVLTPHPAEAARLLGCSTQAVQEDRPHAARALAQRYQACVVLKGAGSLIAAPDGRLALCDLGHPAMASAGLGDVLAGLIGALLGQAMAPFEAACLGVWLHAKAGQQLGAQGRGLAAGDLPAVIRRLLEEQAPCLS